MTSRSDNVKERILALAQDVYHNQRAGITEAIVDALCEELDSMERTLLEEIHRPPLSFTVDPEDAP